MSESRPVCYKCHIVLTFPELQKAVKIEINGETLYFHPYCYRYFFDFVYGIYKRMIIYLNLEPEVQSFNDFFEAQRLIEKGIKRILRKSKNAKSAVKAARIYDLWILSVSYLRCRPNINFKVIEEIEKINKSLRSQRLENPP
ncbi:MAG: hypothetical protein AB1465_01395 [Patescibacteria group bacterium]